MAEMRRKSETVRGKYCDGADPAAEREAVRRPEAIVYGSFTAP